MSSWFSGRLPLALGLQHGTSAGFACSSITAFPGAAAGQLDSCCWRRSPRHGGRQPDRECPPDDGHPPHHRAGCLAWLPRRGRAAAGGDGRAPSTGHGAGHPGRRSRRSTAFWSNDDIETKEPVTLDTRLQIGSLTKTFTGTAVIRLIDAGQARPVRARPHLPDRTFGSWTRTSPPWAPLMTC